MHEIFKTLHDTQSRIHPFEYQADNFPERSPHLSKNRMAQRKRNIEFSRPEEPAFLKKLKSKIGYQDNDNETIETKKANLPHAKEGELSDRDDEQPVYLISDDASITEGELNEFKSKLTSESVKEDSATPQKILFKKPNKDKDKPEGMQTFQSNKKDQNKEAEAESAHHLKKNIKSVKNANLLSFNEDDDED